MSGRETHAASFGGNDYESDPRPNGWADVTLGGVALRLPPVLAHLLDVLTAGR